MTDIRKILIIRFSSLGDVVLTFPLIRKLKETFPSTELNFLVKENYSEILKLNPHIDNIILLNDKAGITKEEIISSGYDLIVDLQKNLKSIYVSSGKGKTVRRVKKDNLKKMMLVLFKWNLFKEVIPVYKKYLNAVNGLITLSKEDFTLSELHFSKDKIIDGKYIVIAPSSRHFTKTYPKEKFAEYIKTLKDVKAVLTGDNSERDISICRFIEKECPVVINMCGKLNMKSLLNVIYNSEYIISNDSAVMHLAEAIGKKVIALFGCTVKEFGFFPQLKSSVVIENSNLKCRPCTHIGKDKCPEKHFRCMDYKIDF